MLVASANWRIGDGSLRCPPAPGAASTVVAALRRAVLRGAWRADGRYAPLHHVDLVLAGDTFDPLLSREWVGSRRPWERGPMARGACERALGRAVGSGRVLLRSLVAACRGGVTVPGADSLGRPAAERSVVVPVRLTLLEGNLDAGLAVHAADLFAGLPDVAVGCRFEGDGVRVEHGHLGDPVWSRHDPLRGATPSLGSSLWIDLLLRLATADATPATRLRGGLVERLAAAEILAWPEVVATAVSEATTVALADGLCRAWESAVAAWRRAARGSGVALDVPFDAVDSLAGAFLGEPVGDDLRASLRPLPITDADVVTVVSGHLPAAAARRPPCPRVVSLAARPVDDEPSPRGVRVIGPVATPFPPPLVAVHRGDGDGAWDPGTGVGPCRYRDVRIVDAA